MSNLVCKYCKDEFCVNDQCPMRADYCPVPDIPGVCKHEERIEEKIETPKLTPRECLHKALGDPDIDTFIIYKEFEALLAENGWTVIEHQTENDSSVANNKFMPGQVVGIDEIANSHDWVFERMVKDHDIHESITYVTRDRTLIVSFDADDRVGTIMLNRKGKEDIEETYYLGQHVHVGRIGASPLWMYVEERNDEAIYMTKDKSMFVSFKRDSDWGVIKKNIDNRPQNTDFEIGQKVTKEEIDNSNNWRKTGSSCSLCVDRYISRDGKKFVHFVDGFELGIVRDIKTEFEFKVGKQTHIGSVLMSYDWYFVGEENNVKRFIDMDKKRYIAFIDGSEWGTVMLNQ